MHTTDRPLAVWQRLLTAGILTSFLVTAAVPGAVYGTESEADAWHGIWGASMYGPYPAGPLDGTAPPPLNSTTTPGALVDDEASDQSFRMVVAPTLGAETIRLRFSNVEGDRPLVLGAVTIGIEVADAAIDPTSLTAVTFDGEPTATIPAGEERASDAVSLTFDAGQRLAVSIYTPGPTGPLTWHAVSFDTQHLTRPGTGDATDDVSGLPYTDSTLGWFLLTGVDRLVPATDAVVVTFGDSITDGAYQVPTSDTRYPDLLATRLRAAGFAIGVVNSGINGNTVTDIGDSPGRGSPALQRFDRDVLDIPGVTTVLIFEGTNDLWAGVPAVDLIGGLRSLVQRAADAGICVVLGTITPRSNTPAAGWDATKEAERRVVNDAIRTMIEDGTAAALADFDAALASPTDPFAPNPALYFPDLLHPNSAGFQVMADAIDLGDLQPEACTTTGAPPAGTASNEPDSSEQGGGGGALATTGGSTAITSLLLLLGGATLSRRRH